MEERNFLEKMDRIVAPPGFERRVLAELSRRKQLQRSSGRMWRFAYAGAAAVVLTAVVIGGVFVLDRTGGKETAGAVRLAGRPAEAVPVMETLDYSSEYRNASSEPRTIYILEQVSEVSPREITY
jgi:anti-sigma-K factor RskA